MTIRGTLIHHTASWLSDQYPDALPEAEIKPALKMCADMLYNIRDVRKANAFLYAFIPGGKGERALHKDVREMWEKVRAEKIKMFDEE